ncbi:MAG: hypothetical protein M0Z62_06980 [Actinomycetota bacterium]|nr:hypothetical protein [Actinomycetota bacterium]
MIDPCDVVRAAASNNAALCDAVCRAHGITGRLDDDAWTSSERTPPLYPDAVTLAPAVDADSLLARVDATAGCSIKDSFSMLPLDAHGFGILFEADWIVLPPDRVPPARSTGRDLAWRAVSDAAELGAWEDGWRGDGPVGTFPATVLDGDLEFLAGYDGDAITAGVIANQTDGVVGVSNIFTKSGSIPEIWPGCLHAIARRFPNLPIVGYESGASLRAALRHGFAPVGRLRVWVLEAATADKAP